MTKRAGRQKDVRPTEQTSSGRRGAGGSAKPQVKKAAFESTKKREVGVSDLTLISKISNEAINENLKKRFESAEIYVSAELSCPRHVDEALLDIERALMHAPRHTSVMY